MNSFGAADLEVSQADSPDPVRVGGSLTYRIAVTNRGPDTALNVIVTDVLPATVGFSSCAPSQGTYSNDNGTVYCNLGSILNGATAAVVIVAIPSLEGTITNGISIGADNGSGNRSYEETAVISSNRPPVIDLPGPHEVWVGAPTSFVVSVTDPDHDPLVTMTNTLKPSGATFDGTNFVWTPGAAFCNSTNWIEFVADDHEGESSSVVTSRTYIVVPYDGDGDAMDDGWEWNNFSTLTNTPAGDRDDDDQDNISEYIAGTQPTNANSRFVAAGVRSGTTHVISWPWAAGREYDVYRGTNLTEGLSSLASDLTGSAYTDTVTTINRAYYRVRVRR